MNAVMFRSFVKEAMALQADQDTPGEYAMVKAAALAKLKMAAGVESVSIERRFPILGRKELHYGIGDTDPSMDVRSQASNHLPESHRHLVEYSEQPYDSNRTWHDARFKIPVREAEKHESLKSLLALAKEKRAWNTGELAGLGILAAPAVSNLVGRPMEEHNKDIAEVAGLGLLAAPYAHNIAAARSARYANSGVGKYLANVFGH